MQIPYDVIKDGATIDIRVMTKEEMERRRCANPKVTYLPLQGIWINQGDPMKPTTPQSGYTLFEAIMALFAFALLVGIPALIIWVVVHFVAKFW